MPITVAALYIDPKGAYPKLPNVECWDASRDARQYTGPHPIVAHPPCRHWVTLSHLAHTQCTACDWHGPWCKTIELGGHTGFCPKCETLVADDSDCALRAVEQVRLYGGVLEHPADSRLWGAKGLPVPGNYAGTMNASRQPDPYGYAIEVDQCAWGHVARKRTWLYLVGVPRHAIEPAPFPNREPTHWCSGSRHAKRGAVPPGIKVCSAVQRRRTPQLFAEYLVRLARSAR